MARVITVDFEDGTQHIYQNAPDDMTPEVAMTRAERDFGKKVSNIDGGRAADLPSPGQKFVSGVKGAWEGLKSGATDVVRGASSALANMVEMAGSNSLNEAALFSGKSVDPTKNRITVASDAVGEALPRPEGDSPGRQFLRAGLEGVGGALVAGGKPNVVGTTAGFTGGISGEVADRIAPNNPLAKAGATLIGGFAGGTGAALATRLRPQSVDVARKALEGLTPEQLSTAQQYKNIQAAKGNDIDLAQALQATSGHSGNLESIRNFLAQRKQGGQVQSTLRGQPEQLAREAELTAGSLPGKNYSGQVNANNIQQTASDVLSAATKDRSAAVKADYEAAGNLPPEARNALGQILNKYATQPGATEVLKGKAQEFAQKLLGNDPKLSDAVESARQAVAAATSPSERVAAQSALAAANAAAQGAKTKPLSALDVNTWIGELAGPWKGQELKIAYPKEQGQIKGLAGELNNTFQGLSPEVAKAAAKYQQITNDIVAPLKQGPIGLLNQAHGADPSTAAMVSKFEGLMNKGTDPTAKVSDIATAVKELGTKDPTSFENAFKGWVSRKVQASVEPGVGDVALSQANPEKLYANLFKDPLQWQGIKDATAGMAKLRGEDPADVIRGLENLRQLTIAMKNRPEAIGGVTGSDLKQLGGSSNVANLVRVASFLPVNRMGEAIERSTFGKTMSELDRILTSPEGADMLIKLGKVPVMSKKAQVILGTWGSSIGNSPALQNSNPPE